jgi:transcriptional regulator with XRE-family HTH domain
MTNKPSAKRTITKSGRGIRLTSRACGPLDTYFGEKLRARRVMMKPKMSQADLGQRLGITFQQIQKYEKGVNRMSAAALVEIASHLKIDIEYFFDELPSKLSTKYNGGVIKTPELTEMVLTKRGPRLIKSFLKLKNNKLREAVTDFVEVLAKSPLTAEHSSP